MLQGVTMQHRRPHTRHAPPPRSPSIDLVMAVIVRVVEIFAVQILAEVFVQHARVALDGVVGAALKTGLVANRIVVAGTTADVVEVLAVHVEGVRVAGKAGAVGAVSDDELEHVAVVRGVEV